VSLTVQIVAPDRELWSGVAERVTAPSVDGEIGLLTGHEPLLALMRPGVLRIVRPGDEPLHVDVTGGFISFDHDAVTIVADTEEEIGK